MARSGGTAVGVRGRSGGGDEGGDEGGDGGGDGGGDSGAKQASLVTSARASGERKWVITSSRSPP